MKKILYTVVLALAFTSSICSCKNDWTVKDVPPIKEKATGFGYVSGFNENGSVLFAVDVPAAGTYTLAVCGRAAEENTPGTGSISAGQSSAQLSFAQAGTWQEVNVSLALETGLNNIEISAGDGNGLFHIDYLELK